MAERGPQGALVAHSIQRLYEVFAGSDSFPMQSAAEFPMFLTKIEEVLIKLDSVDGYPPLLCGEFLHFRFSFHIDYGAN